MIFYQLAVTAVLLAPLAIALRNFFTFAAMRREERPLLTPKVSVLVPARNEEESLPDCVASLLHQTYGNLEVIVLDDNSEDATPQILRRFRQHRPDLTVLQGLPLPPGWTGKNWACRQLAAAATGELLVFTDADTTHRPESVAAIVAFAERSGAQFFSGVPRQRMETFWEKVIIPMTQFLYFAYLPNRWITTRRNPKFSAANGQLLCVTRAAYDRMNGHESVRGELVEDVMLGRRAKELGLRTALASAVDTVECRMYRSLREIVAGFSKNFFPGLGYSLPLLVGFILFSLALYVAPLGFLVAATATGDFSLPLFILPLVQLLIGMSIRALTAARFRMSALQPFLHPLSTLMAVVIGINSARLAFSPAGHTWKGRSYGSPGAPHDKGTERRMDSESR